MIYALYDQPESVPRAQLADTSLPQTEIVSDLSKYFAI